MAIGRWQANILQIGANGTLQILPNADVQIVDEETGLPATIYGDLAGTIPKANPFTADANGYAFAYLEQGRYKIEAQDVSSTATLRDVFVTVESYDKSETDTVAEDAAVVFSLALGG